MAVIRDTFLLTRSTVGGRIVKYQGLNEAQRYDSEGHTHTLSHTHTHTHTHALTDGLRVQ